MSPGSRDVEEEVAVLLGIGIEAVDVEVELFPIDALVVGRRIR